jgi:hypothetical protein
MLFSVPRASAPLHPAPVPVLHPISAPLPSKSPPLQRRSRTLSRHRQQPRSDSEDHLVKDRTTACLRPVPIDSGQVTHATSLDPDVQFGHFTVFPANESTTADTNLPADPPLPLELPPQSQHVALADPIATAIATTDGVLVVPTSDVHVVPTVALCDRALAVLTTATNGHTNVTASPSSSELPRVSTEEGSTLQPVPASSLSPMMSLPVSSPPLTSTAAPSHPPNFSALGFSPAVSSTAMFSPAIGSSFGDPTHNLMHLDTNRFTLTRGELTSPSNILSAPGDVGRSQASDAASFRNLQFDVDREPLSLEPYGRPEEYVFGRTYEDGYQHEQHDGRGSHASQLDKQREGDQQISPRNHDEDEDQDDDIDEDGDEDGDEYDDVDNDSLVSSKSLVSAPRVPPTFGKVPFAKPRDPSPGSEPPQSSVRTSSGRAVRSTRGRHRYWESPSPPATAALVDSVSASFRRGPGRPKKPAAASAYVSQKILDDLS